MRVLKACMVRPRSPAAFSSFKSFISSGVRTTLLPIPVNCCRELKRQLVPHNVGVRPRSVLTPSPPSSSRIFRRGRSTIGQSEYWRDRLTGYRRRTACLAAVAWAAFVLVVTATLTLPDWTIATPIAAVWGSRHLEFWSCRSPFLNSSLTIILVVRTVSRVIESDRSICNDVFRPSFSDLSSH